MSNQSTPTKVQPEPEQNFEVDWESLDMEPPSSLSKLTAEPASSAKPNVDKHIPIPTSRRKLKYNWPFDVLEIGDSFQVSSKQELAAVRVHIHKLSKVKSHKFKTQQYENLWRVWRIA